MIDDASYGAGGSVAMFAHKSPQFVGVPMGIGRRATLKSHGDVVDRLIKQIVQCVHIVATDKRCHAIDRDNLCVVPGERAAGNASTARAHTGNKDRQARASDLLGIAYKFAQKRFGIDAARRILPNEYSNCYGSP